MKRLDHFPFPFDSDALKTGAAHFKLGYRVRVALEESMIFPLLLALLLILPFTLASHVEESDEVNSPRLLSTLPEAVIGMVMIFGGPEGQAKLSTCSRSLKRIAREARPFQSHLAVAYKIPAIRQLPLHYDLIALMGVDFSKCSNDFHIYSHLLVVMKTLKHSTLQTQI